MADFRIKAYSAAAAVFVLDRLSKAWIESHIGFQDAHKVIPGFFDIVHSENRGIAFGILDGSDSAWRTALLIALSLAAVAVMGVVLWKSARKLDRLSQLGFALMMGGAAGNVFDRIVWGRVTDFLLLYIGQHEWPAFNVADSAISIGGGLVILDLLLSRQAANVS
ncbi:MAG TPA: signal peptidase II [Bryobacteraceae bacterium]|nr:signal peptidase II [Bryobacteraceae bacterium]